MTTDDFRLAMPEFENADEGRIQQAIDDAVNYHDVDRWGPRLARGMRLFVAHEVRMAERLAAQSAGTLGLAIEKKVGNVSVRYSDEQIKAQGDDWFKNTGYGTLWLAERDAAGFGAVAV